MPEEAAARDIKVGDYASWREAERILPNVYALLPVVPRRDPPPDRPGTDARGHGTRACDGAAARSAALARRAAQLSVVARHEAFGFV